MSFEFLEDINTKKPYRFQTFIAKLRDKREEKRCRRQRAKKGYADCDVWEMRNWFVKTVGAMLLEFSEKTHNHPDKVEFEEWRNILLRMSELLTSMDIWDDTAIKNKLDIEKSDSSEEALNRISEERYRAKEEFFTLFNEWFYDLWY